MHTSNTLSENDGHPVRYGLTCVHKSGLFLVLVVGFSLMQIMSVFDDGDLLSSVTGILNSIGSFFETKILTAFENTLRIVQLASTVSGILIAVCMWELFVRSHNDSGEMLSIARFLPICHMVNSVIVWVQMFIPLGLVWFAIYRLGGPTDWNQTAHQVLFWVVIALSVFDAVVIHYHLSILSAINIVITKFSGSGLELNVPLLVIVESIVFGSCGIALALIQRSGIGGFVTPAVYLVAGGVMMKVRQVLKWSE